jgi:hypothetical protein
VVGWEVDTMAELEFRQYVIGQAIAGLIVSKAHQDHGALAKKASDIADAVEAEEKERREARRPPPVHAPISRG